MSIWKKEANFPILKTNSTLPSPYPLQENNDYSSEFVTDQAVTYSVYFLNYSVLFSNYPKFAEHIFTFNIDVINGNPDENQLDERIGLTIVYIFQVFFHSFQNVAIYVCDNLDDRHLARKKKFDNWFWRFNDGSLIKQENLAVVEGVEIYNSMIVHKENPNLKEIILAFKELNMRADNK